MVWYGMENVDLYSAIITTVSNALNTPVSGEKPGFQALSKGLVVLLCTEVVRQGVPDHGSCSGVATLRTAIHLLLTYLLAYLLIADGCVYRECHCYAVSGTGCAPLLQCLVNSALQVILGRKIEYQLWLRKRRERLICRVAVNTQCDPMAREFP